MDNIEFKQIDLALHAEICMKFRADSFFCSFGTENTFWEEDGLGGERYLNWLKTKIGENYSGFHLWQNEEIIGQIELGLRKPGDDFGYVNLYYLKKEFRGKGLSNMLDDFSMNYLAELGFKKARLSVSPSNKRAWVFYQKFGWKDIGLRVDKESFASELVVHFMEKAIL